VPRAVIPQYQPNRVQTQPLGVQEVTANTAPARAVAQLAGNLGAFAEQKLAEHDETVVREALTSWDQEALQLKYGPTGIVGKQGKDYLDAMPDTVKAFDDLDGRVAGAAQNSRQQQMIRDQLAARRQQVNGELSRIETNERTKYDEAVAFGKVSTDAQVAAMSPDENERGYRVATARSELWGLAKRRGLGGPDSEAATAFVRDGMTGVHNTVLSGYKARQDYEGAAAYLEANKRDFNPVDYASAKSDFAKMDTFAKGRDAGNQLFDLWVTSGETMDVEAGIAKIKDPVLAQQVSEQYQRRVSIYRRDAQNQAVQVKNRLEAKMARREQLTPEDRLDADKYGFTDELVAWESAPIANDSPVYQAYRTMDPREFARLNRQDIIDLKVSPDDRIKLLDRFDKGTELASKSHVGAVNEIASLATAQIMADGKARKGPKKAAMEAQVRTMAAVEVAAWIEDNKTPPNPAQIKAIVARITSRGEGEEYFALSDAGQLYAGDRDLYAGALKALTPPGGKVDPKADVKPDREWASQIVGNMADGKPALPFRRVPDYFKRAMAEDFITMTPSEIEEAFTAYVRGENLAERYAGKRKGSTGLAGGPR